MHRQGIQRTDELWAMGAVAAGGTAAVLGVVSIGSLLIPALRMGPGIIFYDPSPIGVVILLGKLVVYYTLGALLQALTGGIPASTFLKTALYTGLGAVGSGIACWYCITKADKCR
ncbi:MAG: hypothetical protein AB7F31_03185 [Parachlamydiales bacterium]